MPLDTEKSNKKTGHASKPGQPYGEEAYQALHSKVYWKNVKLDILDIDKYKRSVGIVWLNGKNINREWWQKVMHGHTGSILIDHMHLST